MELPKKPVLSVIIPIYNGENYIDDLFSCICAQQMTDMELILVDDGSTDLTLVRCRELERKHAWIKSVHTENKGVSHARNIGLELAQGRWIHFMDADDLIKNGMYSAFLKSAVADDPDIIICGCTRIHIKNSESTDCGPLTAGTLDEGGIRNLFDHMRMEDRYWILDYIWNKWYRRDLIEKYGIRFQENLSLGEDFVFNAQYFRYTTRISLISECYYQYLIRETGLVSRFYETPWEGRNMLYEAQVKLYQSMHLFHTNEKYLQLQAGRIAFGDIRAINSPRCCYTGKEKTEFVRNMIESSQYIWIMEYLKQKGKNSLLFRIYCSLFLTHHAGLIKLGISLEKIIYRFLKNG